MLIWFDTFFFAKSVRGLASTQPSNQGQEDRKIRKEEWDCFKLTSHFKASRVYLCHTFCAIQVLEQSAEENQI